MTLEKTKEHKSFGGTVGYFKHKSTATNSDMTFSVFLPSTAASEKLPCLYWLSGLTCSEENFTTKSGYQRLAEKHGIIVVAPDTSPRHTGITDEDKDWDFGSGAGFYVDATQAPWSKHYQMYSYIAEELPALVNRNFPVLPTRAGIMGHSMGGHGALVIGLRSPERYQSISAFSPICAPTQCPWGHKAFGGYLGDDRSKWRAYDATEILKSVDTCAPTLIDQGLADSFLQDQLRLDLLEEAVRQKDLPITIKKRAGYDHSYFYISTFLAEHFSFHAKELRT